MPKNLEMEGIVLKLIRIQEPKGGYPLSVEELVLNYRYVYSLGYRDLGGIDAETWQQIISMSEPEVFQLFLWLANNRNRLRSELASQLGIDSERINLGSWGEE